MALVRLFRMDLFLIMDGDVKEFYAAYLITSAYRCIYQIYNAPETFSLRAIPDSFRKNDWWVWSWPRFLNLSEYSLYAKILLDDDCRMRSHTIGSIVGAEKTGRPPANRVLKIRKLLDDSPVGERVQECCNHLRIGIPPAVAGLH